MKLGIWNWFNMKDRVKTHVQLRHLIESLKGGHETQASENRSPTQLSTVTSIATILRFFGRCCASVSTSGIILLLSTTLMRLTSQWLV